MAASFFACPRHTDTFMSDIARQVIAQIAAVLGEQPERITPDMRLDRDLGADSLDFVSLVLAIEARFGLDMPDEEAEQLRTVQQWIEYVELALDVPLIHRVVGVVRNPATQRLH